MDFRKPAVVLLIGVAAACGSSSKTSSTSPTSHASSSTSSPAASTTAAGSPATAATAITVACPSGATIGAAFGRTYPAPITLPATGLQVGAHGVACEYLDSSTFSAAIVDLGSGVTDPGTSLTRTEAAQRAAASARGGSVTFTNVSGVGDRAVYFNFSVPGHTENGIFAGNGGNYFVIVIYPAATEAQIEALAREMLA